MREKHQKQVRIEELDGSTLKAMIVYCYTGKLKITSENVLKLLQAGSMLMFDLINDEVELFLIKQLHAKPKLCLEIFQIAERFSFDKLIAESLQMIGKCFRCVVKKPIFGEMQFSLLERILQSNSKFLAREEEIFEAAMKWVKCDKENREMLIPEILKSIRLVHIDASVHFFFFFYIF